MGHTLELCVGFLLRNFVYHPYFSLEELTTDWRAGAGEPCAEAICAKGLPVRHPEEGGWTCPYMPCRDLSQHPRCPSLSHPSLRRSLYLTFSLLSLGPKGTAGHELHSPSSSIAALHTQGQDHPRAGL